MTCRLRQAFGIASRTGQRTALKPLGHALWDSPNDAYLDLSTTRQK